MTIFLKVCKELIDRVLTKSIEDSIAADQYSFYRKKALSEKQRSTTRDLQKIVDEFLTQEDDKHNVTGLQGILSIVDTEIENYRKTFKEARGHLNNALTHIHSGLDRFYYKLLYLEDIKLLEVPEDEADSFNILCSYALYYLGEHIICPPEEGAIQKTCKAVSTLVFDSSSIEIRDQKEKCLISHLIECKKKIDGLDRTGEKYQELRKTHVIDTINAILKENNDICEDSKPISTFSIQLNVFLNAKVPAPKMKPSRGRLDVAMNNALDRIKEVAALENISASTNTNTVNY
jgi:hypothetical protein